MKAYLNRQYIIILWIAKHKHISGDEAGMWYVKIGLAEKFARKHKGEYDLTK